MKLMRLLLLASLLWVGGCASNSHCRSQQAYQQAPDRAPLAGVEGLQIPESASSLRIPPPVSNPVAFGSQTSEGWSCLDIPPKLNLPEGQVKS